jgi:CPL1-like protein
VLSRAEKGGGCTLALTPLSPIGKDCSVLPGVADVSCLYGECFVYRCLPGYELALDHHSCVRKYSQYDDAEDVPARVYGLEHVPLGRQ